MPLGSGLPALQSRNICGPPRPSSAECLCRPGSSSILPKSLADDRTGSRCSVVYSISFQTAFPGFSALLLLLATHATYQITRTHWASRVLRDSMTKMTKTRDGVGLNGVLSLLSSCRQNQKTPYSQRHERQCLRPFRPAPLGVSTRKRPQRKTEVSHVFPPTVANESPQSYRSGGLGACLPVCGKTSR
jgi:hypothetical protein